MESKFGICGLGMLCFAVLYSLYDLEQLAKDHILKPILVLFMILPQKDCPCCMVFDKTWKQLNQIN